LAADLRDEHVQLLFAFLELRARLRKADESAFAQSVSWPPLSGSTRLDKAEVAGSSPASPTTLVLQGK
jgi:hypothetical protein